MVTIGDVLQHKGREIYSISPDATVFDALKLIADKNIGSLLVLDETGGVQGIFTERDYARKVILKGKSSKSTLVREIMTPKVYYVETGTTIDECMALMTKQRFRHLPVLKENDLVGVVSIGDIVNAVISEKNLLIDQLEHYISGSV